MSRRMLASLPRSSFATAKDSMAREWLVTNGIGGYAAGTVAQANTRRYHGLLVASLRPPVERMVMVAKVDASIRYQGQTFSLGPNEFDAGTLAGRGFELISQFYLDRAMPVWTYSLADAVVEQRIWMAHGSNTTYVMFTVLAASAPLELEVMPLCAYRDYHSHGHGIVPLEVAGEAASCTLQARDGARSYRLALDEGEFQLDPDWYWNFHHRVKAERGLDTSEDLFRPGIFRTRLEAGNSATLTLSADPGVPERAWPALVKESARQDELLLQSGAAAPQWIHQLTLAADQFIVSRHGDDDREVGTTVIAGYPWFSDWGRDTMIALPGLALATGRYHDAAAILRTFARHVSEGMLPNRFPDSSQSPEYNTVDATLWYFHALASYLQASRDRQLLKELFPVLKDIVQWHIQGTRYGIGVDARDGLLQAGTEGVQLTWMDAKVSDWVITPRIGKPVEINALWHFALSKMAMWAGQLRDRLEAARYAEAAQRVADSFAKSFWYEKGGYLFDVIDGPEGELQADGRRADSAIRPNQIFAVALGGELLSDAQQRAVVDTCARHLLTPVGLRSLSPDAANFASRYEGGPAQRDSVYHQGTVWSWLLGPFVLAHQRVHNNPDHALSILEQIAPHLADACIGSISEIFDGAVPHHPRGCFAQAWSVAEILRAWHELDALRAEQLKRKLRHG